ncbi:MAG: penicillin-binding protein, partial [Acidobacteriota bacterium]|nr:penicillin-binding protein [Acidobacteriota bacterium]
MKRLVAVPLAVVSLLQLASVAATTQKSPAKKSTATAARKRTVRRRVPPPVDPTIGDVIDGDDLAVRRAAVA